MSMLASYTALFAVLLAVLPSTCEAFRWVVANTPVAQCDKWTVKWDGGSGPWNITLIPMVAIQGGFIETFTLTPEEKAPPYTASFQPTQPTGGNIIAVMSDSTGWGTGGCSDIIIIQSGPDSSCIRKVLQQPDFIFWTEPASDSTQCQSVRVVWNTTGAVAPLGLHGCIPGGTGWNIPVPPTPSGATGETNFTVNVKAGTQYMLMMTDGGKLGNGGSTNLFTVKDSADSSCLNSNSPSSFPPSSQPTFASSSSSGSGSSPTDGSTGHPSSGSKGTNVGVIVGPVIAGVVVIAAIVVALMYCYMKKKRNVHSTAAQLRPPSLASSVHEDYDESEMMEAPGNMVRVNNSSTATSPRVSAHDPLLSGPLTSAASSQYAAVDPFPYSETTRRGNQAPSLNTNLTEKSRMALMMGASSGSDMMYNRRSGTDTTFGASNRGGNTSSELDRSTQAGDRHGDVLHESQDVWPTGDAPPAYNSEDANRTGVPAVSSSSGANPGNDVSAALALALALSPEELARALDGDAVSSAQVAAVAARVNGSRRPSPGEGPSTSGVEGTPSPDAPLSSSSDNTDSSPGRQPSPSHASIHPTTTLP